MNTQDYLIQARDALNQALISARLDVDNIRRAMNTRDQEMHTKISHLKHQQTERLLEVDLTNSDEWRAKRVNDAHLLQQEEAGVNKDYQQQKRELDNMLSLKQRGIDDITQIVGNLDRQISQANSIPNLTL